MILRGTNGSGKSRALEMLLPFLLDADRRRMDATGAARVSLDELMRTGAQGQSNRTGYLWLELARPGEYLTVGALVRHSQSASSSQGLVLHHPAAGRRGPAADVRDPGAAVARRADRADRGGADHGVGPQRTATASAPWSSGCTATRAGTASTACCSWCTRCGHRMSGTASTRAGCRRSCSSRCRRCRRTR